MKTRNKLIMGLMLISASLFNSCKKGDTGAPGKDGVDGNANVSSVLLNATTWTWDASALWRYDSWSSISILTSDVATSGAVMLYEGSGTTWMAVPYSFNVGSGITIHTFFNYTTGSVAVYQALSNDGDPNPAATTYKLVCIPKKMMVLHPEVNLKNYEQVKAAFDLK